MLPVYVKPLLLLLDMRAVSPTIIESTSPSRCESHQHHRPVVIAINGSSGSEDAHFRPCRRHHHHRRRRLHHHHLWEVTWPVRNISQNEGDIKRERAIEMECEKVSFVNKLHETISHQIGFARRHDDGGWMEVGSTLDPRVDTRENGFSAPDDRR